MSQESALLDLRWREARVAYKNQEYAQCLEIAAEIADDASADIERRVLALHISGDCFLDEKRYEDAIRLYDRLILIRPDEIAHANRGFALMELRRFSEALSSYLAALSMDEGNLIAAKYAGYCLLDLGRAEEALSFSEARVTENPDYAAFYRIKGEALLQLRAFDRAYESFSRAVERDPKDVFSKKALKKLRAAAGILDHKENA